MAPPSTSSSADQDLRVALLAAIYRSQRQKAAQALGPPVFRWAEDPQPRDPFGPDIRDLVRGSEPIDPKEELRNDYGVIGQKGEKKPGYPFRTVSRFQAFFDSMVRKSK
ncbi:hypothetical protein TWF718_010463 [Orbilia javanica]|uniref:Uncharacterized protein n=1 Tax=Orbilia javanica TaxID=47235 RepID=A0AAN8REA7_9PEZI